MLKSIDELINMTLEGKKINRAVRLAPEMDEIIAKNAKAEHLDTSEYIRVILAMHVMPEIIEEELKKEVSEFIIRDGEDSLKLHFSDKLMRFKILKQLTEFAEEKTYNLYKTFFKMEEECLDEIKSKVQEELGS